MYFNWTSNLRTGNLQCLLTFLSIFVKIPWKLNILFNRFFEILSNFPFEPLITLVFKNSQKTSWKFFYLKISWNLKWCVYMLKFNIVKVIKCLQISAYFSADFQDWFWKKKYLQIMMPYQSLFYAWEQTGVL